MSAQPCGCGPCPGCGIPRTCYPHQNTLDIPLTVPCPVLVVAMLAATEKWPPWAAVKEGAK